MHYILVCDTFSLTVEINKYERLSGCSKNYLCGRYLETFMGFFSTGTKGVLSFQNKRSVLSLQYSRYVLFLLVLQIVQGCEAFFQITV